MRPMLCAVLLLLDVVTGMLDYYNDATTVQLSTCGGTCLNKCCDDGYVLQSSRTNETIQSEWECVFWDSVFGTSHLSPLVTFGSADNVRYGFPQLCDASELQPINVADFPSLSVPAKSSCLEKTLLLEDGLEPVEAVMVFVCPDVSANQRRVEPVRPVVRFRKCCPFGQSYDLNNRSCSDANYTREELSVHSVLQSDVSGFVDYAVGYPECQDEVLADYLVSRSNIHLSADRSISVDTPKLRGKLKENSFCVDTTEKHPDKLVVRACRKADEVCNSGYCFRKCCRHGESYVHHTCSKTFEGFDLAAIPLVDAHNQNTSLNWSDGLFGSIAVQDCSKYYLDPTEPIDQYFLRPDGKLYHPFPPPAELSSHQYCLEAVDGELFAFQCFEEYDQKDAGLKYLLCSLGLSTSCVFLLATLLVYALLPSLQNLHGKTLMCHVASLLTAFVCLTANQLGLGFIWESNLLCVTIGFVMLFSFLASFFWLNIMCFDIWWTFGGTRSIVHGTRHQRERRHFIWYSLYSWGIPSVVTGIAVAADNIPHMFSGALKPNFGSDTCWFEPLEYARIIYFYGPVLLLLTCNMVLFVMTARNCSKVKAEIHRMQTSMSERRKRRYQADKTKLLMNVKLFVVMGVGWGLEMASEFIRDPPWVWYLADTNNALQGLLIFCIFVLKRKVMWALKQRVLTRFRPRRPGSGGSSSTTLRITTCYDPNRIRKSTSSSTLCTAVM